MNIIPLDLGLTQFCTQVQHQAQMKQEIFRKYCFTILSKNFLLRVSLSKSTKLVGRYSSFISLCGFFWFVEGHPFGVSFHKPFRIAIGIINYKFKPIKFRSCETLWVWVIYSAKLLISCFSSRVADCKSGRGIAWELSAIAGTTSFVGRAISVTGYSHHANNLVICGMRR
ncbi:MAG: hypothetical protein RLZZ139_2903 [Cyanobacteriota bacterium]|jgi:hypothetical protein